MPNENKKVKKYLNRSESTISVKLGVYPLGKNNASNAILERMQANEKSEKYHLFFLGYVVSFLSLVSCM